LSISFAQEYLLKIFDIIGVLNEGAEKLRARKFSYFD